VSRYGVVVTRTESAYVEVEAACAHDARRLAEHEARAGDHDWLKDIERGDLAQLVDEPTTQEGTT